MATRMYFTTAGYGINATYDAGWTNTSEAGRYYLYHGKWGSSLATGTRIGPMSGTAGDKWLDRMYISEDLKADVLIDGTFSAQLMAREYAGTDDVDQVWIKISAWYGGGPTLRGVIYALASPGPTTEFINNASHRNKTIANAVAVTPLQCYSGDRIVVEIGASNSTSGTSPEFSFRYGDQGTDLPVDETQTTDAPGWIEFSNDLVFQSNASPNSLMLTGMGI